MAFNRSQPNGQFAASVAELTATVRTLSGSLGALAAPFARNAPPTAFPAVDFTPGAPGTQLARRAAEVLTPDGATPPPRPPADAAADEPERAKKFDWSGVANRIGDSTRRIFGGLQSIASMGGQPASAIAAVGGQLGQLASLFGPWGAAAGALISTVSQLPQLFKSAADSVAEYVKVFSPATAGRYERAWADLSGSIGELLIPVLEGATRVVRWFGDTAAGLTPVLAPLVETYMGLLSDQWSALGDVVREMATQGALTVEALRPLLPLLVEIASGPARLLTAGLRAMADAMRRVNDLTSRFLGISLQFDGSSFGKSAVSASTGSVSQLISRSNEAAFGAAAGGSERQQMKSVFEQLRDAIKELPGQIAKAIREEAPRQGRAAVNSVRDRTDGVAARPIRDVMRKVVPPPFRGLWIQ